MSSVQATLGLHHSMQSADSTQFEQLLSKANDFLYDNVYDSAVYYYTSIKEQAIQEKHWKVVVTCNYNLASILTDKGEFDQSEALLLRTIKIIDEHFEGPISLRADVYSYLGHNYSQKANFPIALSYLKKAADIYLKTVGEEHKFTARAYASMGAYYNNLEQSNDLAIASFEKSINIFKSLNMHETLEMSRVYNDLANTYQDMEQSQQALRYHQLSLGIKQKVLVEKHYEVSVSYFNLAQNTMTMGDVEASINYYQEALKIDIHNFGPEHRWVAEDYFNLANCYNLIGSYDKAIRYAQKSVDMLRASYGDEDLKVAMAMNALAKAYTSIEDYKKARLHFSDALQVYSKVADDFHVYDAITGKAQVLNNLGTVMLAEEKYDQAIDYHQEALKIFTGLQDQQKAAIGDTQMFLATAYLKKKDPATAQQYLDEALQNYEQSVGLHHPVIAEAKNLRGDAYLQSRDYNQALQAYQQALACFSPEFDVGALSSFPDKNELRLEARLISSLEKKAHALRTRFNHSRNPEDLRLALSNLVFAADLVDSMRVMYVQEGSTHNSLRDHLTVYEKAMGVARRLYEIEKDAALLETAFYMSERSKSLQLLASLREGEARKFSAVPDAVLQQEKKLMVELAHYESKAQEAGKAQALWRDKAFKVKQSYDSLLQNMALRYPDYHALKYQAEVVSIAQLQNNLLASDEVLLSYLYGDSSIFLMAVSEKSVQLKEIPLDQKLEGQIESLRSALANKKPINKFSASARQLYQKLLGQVNFSAEKLLIVPDGLLSYLPFEVLLGSDIKEFASFRDLPYLTKTHQINYQYSATLMQEQKKRDREAAEMNYLAFAPDFNQPLNILASAETNGLAMQDTVRGRLSELRGTRREVKEIDRWMSGKFFEGEQASEENFKELSGRYKVLHLATHAIVDDQYPMNSRLLFTPSADSLEDGNLHAWELYGLQLEADMVVLSACNTGYGKIQRGEGVMSLGRAFAYAGCPSVVMSLWPAQDQATADLMGYFYEAIADGMEKDEAMQAARLRYLEEADDLLSHPFYWAGFVVQGEPDALTSSFTVSDVLPYSAVALLLIPILVLRRKKIFGRG